MSVIIHKDNFPDIDLDTSSLIYEDDYILIQDEYICDVLKCMNVPEINENEYYDICICGFFKSNPKVREVYALKFPHNAYYYASLIIKGRFELGESVLATDAMYSYCYARDVLRGRFELGEEIISNSAKYSYCYARDVLKGRFELGEPIIATHAHYSYYYATNILEGRFELGEPTILNSEYADEYGERIL